MSGSEPVLKDAGPHVCLLCHLPHIGFSDVISSLKDRCSASKNCVLADLLLKHDKKKWNKILSFYVHSFFVRNETFPQELPQNILLYITGN